MIPQTTVEEKLDLSAKSYYNNYYKRVRQTCGLRLDAVFKRMLLDFLQTSACHKLV